MRKLTQQEVENYYKENGYELLSTYENYNTPLTMKCPKGHISNTMTFGSFKKGCRCSICSRKAKLTYEFVKKQFEKEGYELISDVYVNANTKLVTRCPKNHMWKVTYGHFYSGKRCGDCDKSKKLTYGFVKSQFDKEWYKLLSKTYINATSPLIIKCSSGHITSTMTWNSFQRGQRCFVCNQPKGEVEIAKILKKLNIRFIPQYRFDDCKYKYKLPFDFYLPDFNTCIEFDGKQHFIPVKYFGGEEGFKERKRRDELKNKYCKENDIKLIRIPYNSFKDIKNILLKNLNL